MTQQRSRAGLPLPLSRDLSTELLGRGGAFQGAEEQLRLLQPARQLPLETITGNAAARTVQHTSPARTHWSLKQPCEANCVPSCILKVRKLRPREDKQATGSHTGISRIATSDCRMKHGEDRAALAWRVSYFNLLILPPPQPTSQ